VTYSANTTKLKSNSTKLEKEKNWKPVTNTTFKLNTMNLNQSWVLILILPIKVMKKLNKIEELEMQRS
jgi:hypothetical protein